MRSCSWATTRPTTPTRTPRSWRFASTAPKAGVIGTKQLVKALHPMLDRPELADLVIPDLAKWEDWGVMDKLFDLYKNANEKNSWVRVPVVNYSASLPAAEGEGALRSARKSTRPR